MAHYAMVRFSAYKDKYYVDIPRVFLGIRFGYARAMKPGSGYSAKDSPRYFESYENAKLFAMNCCVDVRVQHKHDINVSLDRI